ncbi:cobalamin-dependent protein [Streptomyces sp. SID3343]|uniref:cobalamin B12-binding domain-containing protein n=1 Tax=Streptomyces sp. SID3343 TaxID=2690260 RepID=UPI001368297B|nr:cobalamin-dependent protein [Streptomyces sp. SID3343]MYW01458.1 cobalamin-binding protein [Streptomyces sp. SID3343]
MTRVIDEEERALYLELIGRADEIASVSLVRGLLAEGVSGEELLTGLVVPALRVVGDRWATGEWTVAREHTASHLAGHAVRMIADASPRPSGRPRVVVCCARGDWHGLASSILATLLRGRGIDTTLLPPGTGAGELARMLPDSGAGAVALGCTMSTALPGARAMVEVARRVGVPVLVGGPGFGVDGRWAGIVGANGWAPDATRAADLLAGPDWPVTATPAPRLRHLPDAAHDGVGLLRAPLVAAGLSAMAVPEREPCDSTMRDGLLTAVDALAVSLFLDDEEVFLSFTRWFTDVLTHRNIPSSSLAAAYKAFATHLAHVPRATHPLTTAGTFL